MGGTLTEVNVKPHTPGALLHICAAMRDVDRKEIYPTFPSENINVLVAATDMALNHGRGGIVWADGVPVAVFGAHPEPLGCYKSACWRAFAFGTDRWKSAVYVVMRELRALVRDVIRDQGTMRLHCVTHEENTGAHKWIEALGGRIEARHPYYGRNGDNYLTYVWLRDEQKWLDDENWKEYSACADQNQAQNRSNHTRDLSRLMMSRQNQTSEQDGKQHAGNHKGNQQPC